MSLVSQLKMTAASQHDHKQQLNAMAVESAGHTSGVHRSMLKLTVRSWELTNLKEMCIMTLAAS